ncbi:hypothetical protein BVY03_04820 [bacterium K02(2017)]|nr:hypothetical protein BVY03_04820 [bacterium K02(2017)]
MPNQIKTLCLILVLLLGVILAQQVINSPSPSKAKARFFKFDTQQIASFQINNFTLGQLFKKDKEGAWLIKEVTNNLTDSIKTPTKTPQNKLPNQFQQANSTSVAKALAYLTSLTNPEVISDQRAKAELYKINSHSLHIVLYDKKGAVLDKIYIGKDGPNPMTSFLKKPDSNKVYLARQNFRLLFFRNFDDWLLKP